MARVQWNKVTWYSKGLAMIVFIVLPFVGFYYGMKYGQLSANQGGQGTVVLPSDGGAQMASGSSTLPAYYANPSAWQTATDTSGGFAISYPIDFDAQDNPSPSPSADWRINSGGQPGHLYFSMTVPKAFEPQTNFSDAALTVGASGNNLAISQCLNPDPSAPSGQSVSTVVINDITFKVFHSADAGAGNYYQTTSYRTLHTGECYAIEYTIHSNQIANYPSSYGLSQFDPSKVDMLMQNVISTFTFL